MWSFQKCDLSVLKEKMAIYTELYGKHTEINAQSKLSC